MTIDTAWLVAALAAGAFVVAVLCGATAGIGARVGERLRKLDQASSQLNDRLGQLEIRGDGRPYDHAIALVRHGADADRLVSHFGLSRGEADLVSLVHGQRKAG